jgi:sporulation protein YlmC with PRC-barrel domain
MKAKSIKIAELTPDDVNANKGTERGSSMLEKSLRAYGAGRSVLVDKAGRIIAGNKTVEAAGSIGLEDALVIETDGTQVVVVKRTDLDLDSPEARGLAVADNRVAEVGLSWDMDALEKLSTDLDVGNFWFENELPDIDFEEVGATARNFSDFDNIQFTDVAFTDRVNSSVDDEEDGKYTAKVEAPTYEITGIKPDVMDLYNPEKTIELVNEIMTSSASDIEKAFLIAAANRHTVFDYQLIAEYYAQSNADIQDLMEKSAIVIIDYNDAISRGFFRMTEDIRNSIEADDDDE